MKVCMWVGLLAFGTEWHGRRETVGPTGCSYLAFTTRVYAPDHGSTPVDGTLASPATTNSQVHRVSDAVPPPKVCVEATNREPNKVRVSLCLTLSCPLSVVVPNHNKNHPSVHQRFVATRSICSTRSPPKALIMSSQSCWGVGFHCTNTHKTTTGSSQPQGGGDGGEWRGSATQYHHQVDCSFRSSRMGDPQLLS